MIKYIHRREKMMWIFLLISMATGVFGVLPELGNCPNMTLVENFDLPKFLGKWYEAERYYSLFSMNMKCMTTNYTMTEDGKLRMVESHFPSISRTNSSAVSYAAIINVQNEPKFELKIDTGIYSFPMYYSILGTDYDNYSVTWSCFDFGFISFRSAWISTRERHPPVAVLESAYKIFEKNRISKEYLFRTDQKNCPDDY